MKEPIWVEINVVMAMHDRLLADHGGSEGLRDKGLLESALARPRQIAAYNNPDLPTLAAAYVAGIVRNHPFVDGNKRTAFMTGYVFLARNHIQLIATESEATHFMLALAGSEITEDTFSEWLRKNSKER